MTNKIIQSNSKISIVVDVIFVKEDIYYVAYCPALELSAYADSIEKAKIAFNKELDIFLEETKKHCTFEKYLLKHGWRLQQIPEINYEPPVLSIRKLSTLLKSSESVLHQEVNIPMC